MGVYMSVIEALFGHTVIFYCETFIRLSIKFHVTSQNNIYKYIFEEKCDMLQAGP